MNFSNNKIKSFPKNLKTATNLEYINFFGNKIDDLPGKKYLLIILNINNKNNNIKY
jgi:Leucine-rich repeat (LRR) protein